MIWLLYLGIAIWLHVLHSVQPPFGDAISYAQKAANFWQAVERGELFNPLNLEPTVRPPGSILVSYPFGFSDSFRGYHFRSVFLPILSIVIAVYITAGVTRESAWRVTGIAFLFSSLPMFYWFDWNDDRWINNGWGMVDNFQAGIAAMAVAAVIRSLATKSQPWLWFGASLASLTFIIKPSGLMVMALTCLLWLMIVTFERLGTSKTSPSTRTLRVYLLKGVAAILVVYISTLALCVFSGYLSERNFAYAQRALTILRMISSIGFHGTLYLFHESAGEASIFWTIGIAVLFVFNRPAGMVREDGNGFQTKELGMLLASGLVMWILGMCYWQVVQGGGNQIRYFYPFMLMGMVCIIPPSILAWSKANRIIHALLLAACVTPAVNMAVLLAAGDSPPLYWQKITGVSVSVGKNGDELRQAHTLLDEARKMKKEAKIYFFFDGVSSYIFICADLYQKILAPELPNIIPFHPMDWSRGFVVRTNELLDSEYILIKKSGPIISWFPSFLNQDIDRAKILESNEFPTFNAESTAIEAFISTLDERSGVKIVSDGRVLRLLRVTDRSALSQAINEFIARKSWRLEFIEANPAEWWSAQEVASSVDTLAMEEIGFDGIYKVHALSIKRIDKDIKIEVWWEELKHNDKNNQGALFLQLVDVSGNILYNLQIPLYPYQPPTGDHRWRYGMETFIAVLPDWKLTSLAFGIHYPAIAEYLLANKGQTDWAGKRVLIPLKEFISLSNDAHSPTR